MDATERRAARELRAAPNGAPRIGGYAAVWDAPSEGLPGFTEMVRAGAFTRTLREGRDVVALVHHDAARVIGRSKAGTLRLWSDHRGLAFEVDVPDTSVGRDLLVSVRRGDMAGASFAFTVPAGGDRWTMRGNEVLRELLDVELHDVTVTALPAYPDTTVAARALSRVVQPHIRLALARRFLQTV